MCLTKLISIVFIFLMGGWVNPITQTASYTAANLKENIAINTSIGSPRDYFPMEKVTMRYSGGFENGGFKKEYKFFSEDKIQVIEKSLGATLVTIYRLNDDQISIIFSKEEYSEDINYINEQQNCDNIILKAPVQVGTTWKDNYDYINTITASNVNIKTPAGEFLCLEVTSIKDNCESKRYFSKNVGLVKDIFKCENFEAISELIEMKN